MQEVGQARQQFRDEKQREHDHIDAPEQIAALLAATEGLYDEIEPDDVAKAEKTAREAVRKEAGDIRERIATGKKLTNEDRDTLIRVMRDELSSARTEGGDGDA